MSKRSGKPKIILTQGDPNGIGPEIILKIFSDLMVIGKYDLRVAGTKKILDKYSSMLGLPSLNSDSIIEIPAKKKFNLEPGKVNKEAGRLSGTYIKKAVTHCLKKEFDAVVTLPISKDSFIKGGFKYPGHTEMLAELTGAKSPAMIMYSRELILSPVTGHIPLKKVAGKIMPKRIIERIIGVNNSLVSDFKIRKPKIAVLSLNPHGGDGGQLGSEEIEFIIPAVNALKERGFKIEGPFAADGYFASKNYIGFDATISMYHDQGLIPFKMISKDKGVNFTGGINIIRTSPNHGTAFDIAGKGMANPSSTIKAIELAAKLGKNKRSC